MVVGQDACGHVAADGVEERGEEREGVPVLARGEVGHPPVAEGRVAARSRRQRGGLGGGHVHALKGRNHDGLGQQDFVLEITKTY